MVELKVNSKAIELFTITYEKNGNNFVCHGDVSFGNRYVPSETSPWLFPLAFPVAFRGFSLYWGGGSGVASQ